MREDTICLIQQNVKYAVKHQYAYALASQCFSHLPPWWIKVFLIEEILRTQNIQGVLWLDSDACIYDHSVKLESLLEGNKSFYMSPDNRVWQAPFNAGVFMVRNDDRGREIMSYWKSLFQPENWSQDPQTRVWQSTGTWAGETYEQGAFGSKVLPRYRDSIKTFKWSFFQSVYSDVDTVDDPIFTLHFAAQRPCKIQYVNKLLAPVLDLQPTPQPNWFQRLWGNCVPV